MMNGNVSVEFLGLFLEPGFCGVVVQKEAKAGKSGGGRGNGPYKGPRGAATSCLQAGRPEVEVFAQAEKSSMSYDNEIRLDLRFSMKFLMGVGVGREAINRFKARGVFSGFC